MENVINIIYWRSPTLDGLITAIGWIVLTELSLPGQIDKRNPQRPTVTQTVTQTVNFLKIKPPFSDFWAKNSAVGLCFHASLVLVCKTIAQKL